MKSRYEYQFVTNYDVDEVIFPRRELIKQETGMNCPLNESLLNAELNKIKLEKYNIYDYAVNLVQLYGTYRVRYIWL